jgi:RNA polymerase sigma-70 factor (ECF subfamily)
MVRSAGFRGRDIGSWIRGEDSVLDPEERLVQRLAANDSAAWTQVHTANFAPLYRLALFRTGSPSVAEDVAAEVFAEAVKGIDRYRYRGVPFRAWLFRIAANIIADYFRANRRRPYPLEGPAAEISREAGTVLVETRLDIRRALAHLNDDQKTVVVLRFMNDLSVREVSEAMGKSEGAVKQLQRRALAALRDRLAGGGEVAE